MENVNGYKYGVLSFIGVIGSFIAKALGGWDSSLQTLLVFICVDYVLGLLLAGVFHKSPKTESGKLGSNAMFKGLCKKGIMLSIVLVSYQVDIMLNTDYVRLGAIIALSVNEVTSITETVDAMGVWVPPIVLDAIDILKKNDDRRID